MLLLVPKLHVNWFTAGKSLGLVNLCDTFSLKISVDFCLVSFNLVPGIIYIPVPMSQPQLQSSPMWLYFKLNHAGIRCSLQRFLIPWRQQSPDTNKSAVILPILVQIFELVTSNLITLINLADITARLKPFRQVYWFWRRHIPTPCG